MSITATNPPDVIVIGAGPSGAIASALLVRKGFRVLVLERETFPRFSIGESLLPHCMQFVEEAGMLEAVQAGGFQFKNGAAFLHDGKYTDFDFTHKFSDGPGTTFQVRRAVFDKILADSAAAQGADIRYRHTITSVDVSGPRPAVTYTDQEGAQHRIDAKFLLDASGFGRVLPRLLDLELPSRFPIRQSVFTHIVDHITADWFDRSKILITVHPRYRDVWFWLIPFSQGVCSLGVVAEPAFLARYPQDPKARLKALVDEEPRLSELLASADFNIEVRQITGYSANVKSLVGNNFALLGNAGEFLDPVFSSGVTIAMRSASMASKLVDRQLRGEPVDWENDYARPLIKGVDTFRTFVTGWYDQSFQHIIFHDQQLSRVKGMICSILAGYAWDTKNPYVDDSQRRFDVLAEICRPAGVVDAGEDRLV
jgi:flavin-dependent dehydrogenase